MTTSPCASGCGSCAGCGTSTHQSCCGSSAPIVLTEGEGALLRRLAAVLYLPMGQFILLPKWAEPEEGMPILSPVLLDTASDSLEVVADRAELLVALANQGLLTLDFDLPLQNYDYGIYYRAELFREFTQRFASAPQGRPVLRRGSIAITQKGLEWAEGCVEG